MTTNKTPKILLIYTGGTIGMVENPVTHALQPFDFSHLIDNVPKVKKLAYDIDNIQFENPIDSSNMNPTHWANIVRAIADNYDAYDGFVVLHGTDTMAYTASALSFMLENLSKPVIITGSQLPIGEVRTDGEENLITAIQVAAARDADGLPVVREVAILFWNYLWRGNRSTKMSADRFDAFESSNYPPLAHVGLEIKFNYNELYRPAVEAPLIPHYEMDTNVMIVDIFPGITQGVMDHMLHTPGIKGVVLKTYGAGNSSSDEWFTSLIRDAVDRGIVVFNVTQCYNGTVNNTLYDTGNTLAEAGAVGGHDITHEAAITKMMYLFGAGLNLEDVTKYLGIPLRGELSPRQK